MSDETKKPAPETLTPIVHGGEGGLAVHHDGEHACLVPYTYAREGENLLGVPAFAPTPNANGVYERLDTGGPRLRACAGPAQVATEAYRDSWQRTFGARGGVS
jgi:hypothetical protein